MRLVGLIHVGPASFINLCNHLSSLWLCVIMTLLVPKKWSVYCPGTFLFFLKGWFFDLKIGLERYYDPTFSIYRYSDHLPMVDLGGFDGFGRPPCFCFKFTLKVWEIVSPTFQILGFSRGSMPPKPPPPPCHTFSAHKFEPLFTQSWIHPSLHLVYKGKRNHTSLVSYNKLN